MKDPVLPNALALANRRYRVRHGGIWLRFEVIEKLDAFVRRLKHDASRTQAAWFLIERGLENGGRVRRSLPKKYRRGRGRERSAA